MNPAYDAEKLGLDMVGTEEPDMSYEFNELLFWRRRDNVDRATWPNQLSHPLG